MQVNDNDQVNSLKMTLPVVFVPHPPIANCTGSGATLSLLMELVGGPSPWLSVMLLMLFEVVRPLLRAAAQTLTP